MSIGSSPFQGGGGSASIADATESTAGKIRIATTSESTTGTNDTTAMTPAKVKARIDAALVGGVEYKGSYTGQSLVTAEKGDLYVSAATYSLAGVQVLSGDHIIFNQDAADPVTSAMFDKIDNTDQVSSVNTLTGAVVLSGANLDGDHSSPSNYSATTDKIEKHLEGIDTALGARQPLDAQLTDVAGLTPADGAFIVGDGSNFVAESGATARASLGLAIGSDVQAFDAQLTDVAGLTPSNNHVIVGDGSNFTAAQLASTQLSDSGDLARLASPALTGTPTAPTATSGTNTTQLATTAFVQAAVASSGSSDTLDTVTGRGATTSNSVQVGGLNVAGSYALPTSDGSAGQILKTDGSGALTFQSLGSISTQAANSVNITGGAISGITDLAIADGGTGASTEAQARTNLGLAIGSDVQAFDAQLTDVAGLTPADGAFIVGDGSNFVAESGATARASLGLAIGSDVQAFDAQLTDVAGLTPADGAFIVGDGSNFVAESGATARASLGLATVASTGAYSDLSGAPTVPTNLNSLTDVSITGVSNGQVISYNSTSGEWENSTPSSGGATDLNGLSDVTITSAATGNILERNSSGQFVNVAKSTINVSAFNDDNTYQLKDAQLTDVAGLTPADGAFIVGDGSNFVAESGATARASLGLAIGSDVQAFDAQLTDVAGLTPSNNHVIVGDGSNFTAAQLASTQLSDTADLARLASPALTGTPTGPTATSGTNTTQLATTAFVQSAVTSSGGVTPTLTVRSGTSYTLTAANAKGVHVWYGGTTSSTFTLTLPAISDVISTATSSDGDPEETFEVYVGRRVAGDITISASDTIDVLGDGSYSYSATQTVRTGQWIKIVGWYNSSSVQRYFMSGSSQPYDAGLESISGLTTAADKMLYTTSSDTYAVTDLTLAGRALLDDADAAAQRSTLGLGTVATLNTGTSNGEVIVADSTGLPAIDGSQLTGVLKNLVEDTSPQLGGDLDLNGQDIVTTSNANLELAPDGTGLVSIKGNTTGGNNQGALKLWCENNSHGVALKSPPHSAGASYNLILPTDVGTAGQVLKTDGGDSSTPKNVQLSWVTQSGGGGGSAPAVDSTNYASQGADFTLPSSAGIESFWIVNPTTAITITLPAAATSGSGYRHTIKNIGSSVITIAPPSGEQGDGGNLTLSFQYEALTLISDGSKWYAV